MYYDFKCPEEHVTTVKASIHDGPPSDVSCATEILWLRMRAPAIMPDYEVAVMAEKPVPGWVIFSNDFADQLIRAYPGFSVQTPYVVDSEEPGRSLSAAGALAAISLDYLEPAAMVVKSVGRSAAGACLVRLSPSEVSPTDLAFAANATVLGIVDFALDNLFALWADTQFAHEFIIERLVLKCDAPARRVWEIMKMDRTVYVRAGIVTPDDPGFRLTKPMEAEMRKQRRAARERRAPK